MSDDQRHIQFATAGEFARAFKQFCSRNPEQTAVFLAPREAVNEYHYRHGNGHAYGKEITGYARFAEHETKFSYAGIPLLPAGGWAYTEDQRIVKKFDGKLKMIKFLREDLGVASEKLATFNKVTVSQLQEMVDSSTEEQDETTHRSSKQKAEKITFPVTKLGLSEVVVTIIKERNNLEFLVSADFSAAWAAVNKSIDDVLKGDLASVPQYVTI